MQEEENKSTTGFVTLDDVRGALGDDDPFKTNAGKLRRLLQRGGTGTVQKHLDKIRAERLVAAQPLSDAVMPKAPGDLITAVWEASWSAAQVLTLSRLDALSIERDGLRETALAQTSDIVELAAQVDELEALAQDYAKNLAQIQSDAEKQAENSKLEYDHIYKELITAKTDIETVKENAAHAEAIAIRDARIERQVFESTISTLTNQLGELKALRFFPEKVDTPKKTTPIDPVGTE